MITIRFFASVREAVGTAVLTIDEPFEGKHVADLKSWLSSRYGDVWQEALFQPNLVHAVNQVVVDPDTVLHDGDEVAFFPPMTGG